MRIVIIETDIKDNNNWNKISDSERAIQSEFWSEDSIADRTASLRFYYSCFISHLNDADGTLSVS